jgi:hypothetical protein
MHASRDLKHTNLEGNLRLRVYEMHKKMLCKLNGFCFFGDELGKYIVLA